MTHERVSDETLDLFKDDYGPIADMTRELISRRQAEREAVPVGEQHEQAISASPPANTIEGWVLVPRVSAALEDVVILCDYAYKVGYHELGYDPVEVLRGAVQKIPQEATEAMIDAAFDATIWPYMTRPTSTEVIAALRENMRKEYRAMISAAPPVSAK